MHLSKSRLKKIIREEYNLVIESLGSRTEGWLGDWYEDCGGYYKDADCFYILDECMEEGEIEIQDAMAVCDELAEYGINTLEDLKQNWCTQRTSAKAAWKAMYASMDSLQDLFYMVDDWRDEKYGAAGTGGNRFPPAVGPYSSNIGGPAFVTCAWCISVC